MGASLLDYTAGMYPAIWTSGRGQALGECYNGRDNHILVALQTWKLFQEMYRDNTHNNTRTADFKYSCL